MFVCIKLLKIYIRHPSCPAYGVVFPAQWPLQWLATRWHNLVCSSQFGYTPAHLTHTTEVHLGHGIYCVAHYFSWLLSARLLRIFVFNTNKSSYKKTSQELRMLSNVTINCQITKIVMNSGSQIVRIVISVSNVTSPRIVQKSEYLPKI